MLYDENKVLTNHISEDCDCCLVRDVLIGQRVDIDLLSTSC